MALLASQPLPFRSGPRVFLWASTAFLLWLLAWIWISWPYSLDDALIHLRYADHLLHEHRITYDGVHSSFGTSSLLYVAVLAALRSVFSSPLLPRALSSLVHTALFLGVAGGLYTRFRRQETLPLVTWFLALGLLAILVTPSAVRWLDDGMETVEVFVVVAVGAFLVRRPLAKADTTPNGLALWFVVYGLVCVLLRVELLSLLGCISLMLVLEPRARASADAQLRVGFKEVLRALAPLAGGCVAAFFIVLTMRTLLPDTAVAKAYGASHWQSTFLETARTMASGFSFGLGLVFFWMLSLAALVAFTPVRVADLLPNLLFPAVLLLAAARGQQIAGTRYLGWTLFFPILCNLLRVMEDGGRSAPAIDRALCAVAGVFFVALLPSVVWESRTFARIFADRGATLRAFQSQHLEGLRGQRGMAEDVGFVGYFTGGDICDPYGLVNGRAAARLQYDQRFAHCLTLHPAFVFGGETLLRKVSAQQSLADWSLCGQYRFDNVSTLDMRYLVVSPAEVKAACPTTAQPLASVLPLGGPAR